MGIGISLSIWGDNLLNNTIGLKEGLPSGPFHALLRLSVHCIPKEPGRVAFEDTDGCCRDREADDGEHEEVDGISGWFSRVYPQVEGEDAELDEGDRKDVEQTICVIRFEK